MLFDIEVVFLYPVGGEVQAADKAFLFVEMLIFIGILFIGLVVRDPQGRRELGARSRNGRE